MYIERMDCGTLIKGKNLWVLAFPALCASTIITLVIVIQMTYIIEDHPRMHLDNMLLLSRTDDKQEGRLGTSNEGDFHFQSGSNDQVAAKVLQRNTSATEKGVVGLLRTASLSDPKKTHVNQTQLLQAKKTFLQQSPPLRPQSDPMLDEDVVKILHLDKFAVDFMLLQKTPSTRLPSLPTIRDMKGELSPASDELQPQLATEAAPDAKHKQYKVVLPKPKTAPQNDRMVVPKNVHVIWFHPQRDCTFRFHQFISLLSVHKFIQPYRIFFWHDNQPCGEWWREVQEKVVNISMMQIEPPRSVFGHAINVFEHKTDVLRITLLLRYGGIYIDLDVVVLKSWDQLMFYDTTMGAENPKILGSGVIISIKASKFMRLWYDSYRAFYDKLWNFNCCLVPMQIAQHYPELIHIEWDTLHRPSWNELDYLYSAGKLWDWSVNYGVHLWYRFHKVEHNPNDIRMLNTTMGELFRYIYYGTADFVT